jgi:hypothetical protein
MVCWLLLDSTVSYGVIGVASPSNYPGARGGHAWGVDHRKNVAYLFGGSISDTQSTLDWVLGMKSDMWMFDLTSLVWVYLGGGTGTRGQPVYGPIGVQSATYTPGARLLYQQLAVGSKYHIFHHIIP